MAIAKVLSPNEFNTTRSDAENTDTMKFRSHLLIVLSFCFLAGCASTMRQAPGSEGSAEPEYTFARNDRFDAISEAGSKDEKDRFAILAMQGEYRVDFDFSETVVLDAEYERQDGKTTGGYETVVVLADDPGFLSLQHILVAPSGHVVKHWRQDWTYEASHRFEFVSDQTWESRPLAAEKTTGAWTQCVYEVSDAPRYCGTGTWNHRYGVSTWTSDRTWRPLPRREYTKREDYNAINAENRHTVTPLGWTHEQDNTKTVREGSETQKTLVRETGFNDYRRIDGYDFSPAYTYWARTAAYWESVRALWSDKLAPGNRLELLTSVSGMEIIGPTFGHAAAQTPTVHIKDAVEVIEKWTQVHEVSQLAAY